MPNQRATESTATDTTAEPSGSRTGGASMASDPRGDPDAAITERALTVRYAALRRALHLRRADA
jgi:hypothetical protein